VHKDGGVYRQRYADGTLADAPSREATRRDSALVERPLVVAGSRAVPGRPLGNVGAPLRS